jgi:hypothetical protein
MLLEAAREAGEAYNESFEAAAAAEQDYVFNALRRLHARACLVACEILWFMEGGYPRLFPVHRSGGPTLLHCAPLILKAALASVLSRTGRTPKKGDLAGQLAKYLAERTTQFRYEKALLKCRPGEKKTR